MSVSEEFKTNIRDWIAYDKKIEKAFHAIKRVKEKKEDLQKNIVEYMNLKNLRDNEFKMSNVRLKYKEKKHTTPITRKFIESILLQELQPIDVQNVLQVLSNPKKRLEICLSYILDDELRASELVQTIYNKRITTYKSVINKKVSRTPLTIDSGPISEIAQSTINTPENSD